MRVDKEKRIIYGCRWTNRDSKHGFYVGSKAMSKMASLMEGKAVNEVHGSNNFRDSVGIMQSVTSHETHGEFDFHVFTGDLGDKMLEVAGKGDAFDKAFCFSWELPAGGYESAEDEDGKTFIEDVDFVMPLAVVEYGGNTNGITQSAEPDKPKFKRELPMNSAELRKTYPDAVKVIESDMRELVSSEFKELKQKYEDAIAKLATKDSEKAEVVSELDELKTKLEQLNEKKEVEDRRNHAKCACHDAGVEPSEDLIEAHASGALSQDAFSNIIKGLPKKKAKDDSEGSTGSGPKIGGEGSRGGSDWKPGGGFSNIF
jgi:hypothetical protein